MEIVDTGTELEISIGDDSVITAVVAPVSVDVDELSPVEVVPVGTETVGNPGGSSDVVATMLGLA